MNLSPTASSASASSVTATSSSASNSTLHPNPSFPPFRRRSVDTGGLNLVVNDHTGSGSGRGYGGWVEKDGVETSATNIAELVMAWKEKSDRMIDDAHPPITPPQCLPTSDEHARKAEFINKLTKWGFDGTNLSLDDVLFCANLLFELLWSIEGMEDDIKVSFDVIPIFLSHVSKLYRQQSCYHNFQHALDVLQAMYYYLHQAGCVPDLHILNDETFRASIPDEQREITSHGEIRFRTLWCPQETKGDAFLQKALRNEEIFALFIASIGHDIGHPGVNNEFLYKAKTPVAELFSERSVLESMHSTLLFQVMRKHGMGHLLDRVPERSSFFSLKHHPRFRLDSDPGTATSANVSQTEGEIAPSSNNSQPGTRPGLKKSASVMHTSSKKDRYERGTEFKTLLDGIILATDMGVHIPWMDSLKSFNRGLDQSADVLSNSEVLEEGDGVSYQTKLLLCQALIKCADISNPSRPPPACKNWSLSLMAEWEQQVLLEKSLDLPRSFTNSADPLKLVNGQLSFLKGRTLPLLEETLVAIPAMSVFAQQCRDNISMWEAKEVELKAKAKAELEVSGEVVPMSPDMVLPVPSSPIAINLPTSLPDVSTIFTLALPPSLQIPAPEISWPHENATVSISTIAPSEPELVASTQTSAEEDANGTCSSGPPSPLVETSLYRIHLSHTELPQVSIPSGQSVLSPSSGFNQIKSGSTMYASPLFSPPSTTTSSTSRSDASSPSPSTLKNARTDDLRAVLDAHQGRLKTRGHWYRRSWQGDISLLSPTRSQVSIAASSALTSDHAPDKAGAANGS